MAEDVTTRLRDIERSLEKIAVPEVLTPLGLLFGAIGANPAIGSVEAQVHKGLNDAADMLEATGDKIGAILAKLTSIPGTAPAEALGTLQAAMAVAQVLSPNSTELAAGSKFFRQLADLITDVNHSPEDAKTILHKLAAQLRSLASIFPSPQHP